MTSGCSRAKAANSLVFLAELSQRILLHPPHITEDFGVRVRLPLGGLHHLAHVVPPRAQHAHVLARTDSLQLLEQGERLLPLLPELGLGLARGSRGGSRT